MIYPLGTVIRLTSTFENIIGVPADPNDITLYVAPPGTPRGHSTAYQLNVLTRRSSGVYSYDLLFGKSGTWTYRWVGTGRVEAATRDTQVYITPSRLR